MRVLGNLGTLCSRQVLETTAGSLFFNFLIVSGRLERVISAHFVHFKSNTAHTHAVKMETRVTTDPIKTAEKVRAAQLYLCSDSKTPQQITAESRICRQQPLWLLTTRRPGQSPGRDTSSWCRP